MGEERCLAEAEELLGANWGKILGVQLLRLLDQFSVDPRCDGLVGEPGVKNLLGHGWGSAPGAHSQNVGIVPETRSPTCLRVPAQGCSNAGDLVGCYRSTCPGPAE